MTVIDEYYVEEKLNRVQLDLIQEWLLIAVDDLYAIYEENLR